MSAYSILKSIRLTGRVVDNALELFTMRDSSEVAEPLDVSSDPVPVRVEIYDFVDAASGPWRFIETGVWQRDTAGFVSAEFVGYTDGDGYDSYEVVAEQTGTTNQKPKTLPIKIKPIIDAPDPT